mgnify:CR=1 FL=1
MPPFTLVGATTRSGLLTTPLRELFGIPLRLEFYNIDDLVQIVQRAAKVLKIEITAEGATEIASRSRGTPRVAVRLLRRVRDFASVAGVTAVSIKLADDALERLEVREHTAQRHAQFAKYRCSCEVTHPNHEM